MTEREEVFGSAGCGTLLRGWQDVEGSGACRAPASVALPPCGAGALALGSLPAPETMEVWVGLGPMPARAQSMPAFFCTAEWPLLPIPPQALSANKALFQEGLSALSNAHSRSRLQTAAGDGTHPGSVSPFCSLPPCSPYGPALVCMRAPALERLV